MPKAHHERAKVFERGQVWYWDDPIYRAKQKGLQVEVGVAGLRYSRYVVIAQDPETADKNMIIVVPCSSKNGTPHDVEIPIDHLYKETHGYAKVQSIMPVHPRTLINYVCRLPDEAMKAIDSEIIKMLNPYVRKNLTDDQILEMFGIDMNVTTNEWYQGPKNDITVYVQMFVNQRIQFTFNKQDVISIQTLKDAFDIFCLDKDIYIECDIVEFLDRLYRQMKTHVNTVGYRNDEHHIFDIINFSGIKLRENSLVVPIESAPSQKGGGSVTEEQEEKESDVKSPVEEEIRPEDPAPDPTPEPVEEPKSEEVPVKKRHNRQSYSTGWTKDQEIQFLRDSISMPRDEMVQKYNFGKTYIPHMVKRICKKYGYEIKSGYKGFLIPVIPDDQVSEKPINVNIDEPKVISEPEQVEEKVPEKEERYTDSGSLMRGFVDKRIKWNNLKFVDVDEVYNAYCKFCETRNTDPMSKDALIKFMDNRCFSTMTNGKGQTLFRSCQLLKSDTDNGEYDLPPDIKNITKGISVFTDHIIIYLQYNNVYGKMYKEANPIYSGKEFYKEIEKRIFHSILASLKIEVKKNNKYIIPDRRVLADDPDSVWFLTMLYTDQSIHTMYNYDALCKRYQDRYNRTPGISRAFIPIFEGKMKYADLVSQYNIETLSEFIAKRFCRQD